MTLLNFRKIRCNNSLCWRVARHIFSFLLILILVSLSYADAFWMYLRETPPNPSVSDNSQNQFESYETSIVALHHVVMSRLLLLIVCSIQ